MNKKTVTDIEAKITLKTPECDILNEIYKPFIDLIRLSIRLSLPEEAIINKE